MINEADYVELGLACADVCSALDRGMDGGRMNELNQSVLGAIGHLTTLVEPVMHTPGNSLTTRSQDRGRDPGEHRQKT